MAFTTITVTGTFKRPDGGTPTGTVTATPSSTLQNGTVVIDDTPIVGALNSGGQLVAQSLLPFTLVANDDAGTLPAGSYYTFIVQVDGAPTRAFDAIVPHTAPGATIDLTALEPTLP